MKKLLFILFIFSFLDGKSQTEAVTLYANAIMFSEYAYGEWKSKEGFKDCDLEITFQSGIMSIDNKNQTRIKLTTKWKKNEYGRLTAKGVDHDGDRCEVWFSKSNETKTISILYSNLAVCFLLEDNYDSSDDDIHLDRNSLKLN